MGGMAVPFANTSSGSAPLTLSLLAPLLSKQRWWEHQLCRPSVAHRGRQPEQASLQGHHGGGSLPHHDQAWHNGSSSVPPLFGRPAAGGSSGDSAGMFGFLGSRWIPSAQVFPAYLHVAACVPSQGSACKNRDLVAKKGMAISAQAQGRGRRSASPSLCLKIEVYIFSHICFPPYLQGQSKALRHFLATPIQEIWRWSCTIALVFCTLDGCRAGPAHPNSYHC